EHIVKSPIAPAFGETGLGGVHEPALEERPDHRLQRLAHPSVQLNLVVQRTQHRSDGALLGERCNGKAKVWNVRAFQAVEDSPDVEEGTDLLPPLSSANKPAEKRRKHLRAVRTKQHKVLAQRAFQTSWNNCGFTRIAPARKHNIVGLRFRLASPIKIMLAGYSTSIRKVETPLVELWYGNVRIATVSRRRRSVVAVN